MGKRFAIVIGVAAAGVMALGAQSAAAAPGGLNGTFRVHFPKGHPASNAPCPTDVFCGVGELVGYGKATITILDETFTEIPDSPCLDTTRVEAIDLIGSSDELVLDEAGDLLPARWLGRLPLGAEQLWPSWTLASAVRGRRRREQWGLYRRHRLGAHSISERGRRRHMERLR